MRKLLKTIKLIAAIMMVVILGLLTLQYLQKQRLFPSTDDAYVQAHVINIATQTNGIVSTTHISNHQKVKKGQLLLELDNRAQLIAIEQAQAKLKQTINNVNAKMMAVEAANALVIQRQAELKQAQQHSHRILTLVHQSMIAKDEGDNAKRQLNVSRAALTAAQKQLQESKDQLGSPSFDNSAIRQAQSQLKSAKLKLSYTRIKAPTDGIIANDSVRTGDEVSAYQPIFALIDSHQWWVNANFKETQLQRIHPKQPATIKIDMYPNHTFKGTVLSISPGSGSSFSLLPPENASGNWIKITQRFPVKILIDENNSKYPLRVGASCVTTIDTRD
jgi:membrane fusion protein (multidrug efflux system)